MKFKYVLRGKFKAELDPEKARKLLERYVYSKLQHADVQLIKISSWKDDEDRARVEIVFHVDYDSCWYYVCADYIAPKCFITMFGVIGAGEYIKRIAIMKVKDEDLALVKRFFELRDIEIPEALWHIGNIVIAKKCKDFLYY